MLGASGRARGVRNTKITLKKKYWKSRNGEWRPRRYTLARVVWGRRKLVLDVTGNPKSRHGENFPLITSLSTKFICSNSWRLDEEVGQCRARLGWKLSLFTMTCPFCLRKSAAHPSKGRPTTTLPYHLLLPTLFPWPKRGYVEFTFGESFLMAAAPDGQRTIFLAATTTVGAPADRHPRTYVFHPMKRRARRTVYNYAPVNLEIIWSGSRL